MTDIRADCVAVLRRMQHEDAGYTCACHECKALQTAIELLERQGDAVAWRYRHPTAAGGWHDWLYTAKPHKRYADSEYEPLYALPPTPAPDRATPDESREDEECPICEGSGRVDSVRKCCGPPKELDDWQRCNRPPKGWYCGLERGHDGSCPTWPVSHETAATHTDGIDEAMVKFVRDRVLVAAIGTNWQNRISPATLDFWTNEIREILEAAIAPDAQGGES